MGRTLLSFRNLWATFLTTPSGRARDLDLHGISDGLVGLGFLIS